MPKRAAGEPVESARGKIRLTYSCPEGYIFGAWLDVLRRLYEPDSLPGIDVVARPVSGDYLGSLTRMFAGDSAPDVFVQPGETLVDWAKDGLLLPLESLLASDEELDPGDFYETQLAHGRLEGKLWALPWCSECYFLFVNQDLVEGKGVELPRQGWTWGEFREMALEFADREQGRWGGGPQHHWPAMAGHIWQNGGEVFDGEGRLCLLDQPAAVEAMEFWADLTVKDRALPDPQEWEKTDSSFMGGQLATDDNPLGVLEEFRNGLSFRWQITLLPQARVCTSFMNIGSHAIGARTPHRSEAWELLKGILRSGVLAAWAQVSHLPVARKSVNVQRPYAHPDLLIDWDLVEEGIEKARPPDLVPHGMEVTRLLVHLSRVILLGAQTVREAVADCVSRVNAVLARS